MKTDIKKISITAMLCALAYLCMFVFKFKVSFLTFDFKDAVLAVTAFLYGPVYGIISALIVALTELISVSDTGIYGFIMNFLSSAVFVGVCGLFYKYKRTLTGAIGGCIAATFAVTVIMLAANAFITPFYMGVERETVIKMLPTLLLPFNFFKGLMNAAVTLIIYKPIVSALRKFGLVKGGNSETDKKIFLYITVFAAVILLIATLVIIFLMNGTFNLH